MLNSLQVKLRLFETFLFQVILWLDNLWNYILLIFINYVHPPEINRISLKSCNHDSNENLR